MSSSAGKNESSNRSSRRRPRGLLRVRRRTKSARAAVVLSGLTAVFIALSYRTGNVVFQFDSIVSFLAALVLLFRDTSHTVQARVVNRILTSSHQLVADLSSYGLGGSSFLYVPEGRRVGDVMLVPVKAGEAAAADPPPGKDELGSPASGGSANSQPPLEGASELSSADSSPASSADLKKKPRRKAKGRSMPAETGKDKATTAISNLKFAPPGRAMAELFLRESALKDPSMEDVIASISQTVVEGFQLAGSVSVSMKAAEGEAVEVTQVHPVLANNCRNSNNAGGSGIVGCEICSMLAILFSSSSGRLVSLEGCTYDDDNDISITSLHLGAKYPAD